VDTIKKTEFYSYVAEVFNEYSAKESVRELLADFQTPAFTHIAYWLYYTFKHDIWTVLEQRTRELQEENIFLTLPARRVANMDELYNHLLYTAIKYIIEKLAEERSNGQLQGVV